jgi:hypothetical protein
VPELQSSWFVEPVEGGRVDRRTLPGLLRREIPCEASGSGPFAQHRTRSSTSAGVDSATADSAPGGAALDRAAPLSDVPADNTVLHAPEVIGMSLRYFGNWSNRWDSLARQTLPLAVEITLQVRAFDDSARAGHAAASPHAIAHRHQRRPAAAGLPPAPPGGATPCASQGRRGNPPR